jgi:putative ATPase
MEQKDLFMDNINKQSKPLAIRMSPRSFEEFVGQDNIVGSGKLLRRLIENDNLCSTIFFGPPGTGKSALARIVASKTKFYFKQANAVTIGVIDIRRIMEGAKSKIEMHAKKTILILDEIHHFNRSQQDVLLPYIEEGIITLVGITTENPLFCINATIISRSIVFEFKSLPKKALLCILDSALKDKEDGFGDSKIKISEEAKEYLVLNACGDARKLLNALEVGVLSVINNAEDLRIFDLNVAQESVQKRTILYSRSGDAHYDYISAFIKSMRGTDPDATVYWMAKMFEAGEDPHFIARRIIICASEDVGIADPRALIIAVSALNAIKFVGMPEARIVLAEAAIYVASAPKSNASYMAVERALSEVKSGKIRNVPSYLKNLNFDEKECEYRYPHDYDGHYVQQDYWSDPVELYTPTEEGYEGKVRERLFKIRKNKNKA